MITRKPGPPVPPRPNTGLLKNHSESPTSRSNVVTSSTKISSSSSSSDAGRTVIYKSPSFDLKKRQQNQLLKENHSQDQTKQTLSQQQQQQQISNQTNTTSIVKQQSIFVTENSKHLTTSDRDRDRNESSATNQLDNGSVTIEKKSNRTEIVIINNNKATIRNKLESDNNNVNETNIAEQELENFDKVSPVPKPRTLVPSKAINNNETPTDSINRSDIVGHDRKIAKSAVMINNDLIRNNNNNSKMIEIKKMELENNLKNAAERLCTEILINQSKMNGKDNDKIIKTEHCISVRSTPSPPLSKSGNNMSRTCVNLSHRPEPEGGENKSSDAINCQKIEDKIPAEKKVAFHEILISELAAMRSKNSVETAISNDHDLSDHDNNNDSSNSQKPKQQRKRYPSGCSTDSSPYGTQRSRIRTSDWVEVGDNGKEVMLTSCHISLEDSGLEDEERLDDTSSGVGDSWDSVKDAEERMSLPGLPPLPKSLSGLDTSHGVPVHNSTGSLASLESQRGISPISRMTTGGTTTTSTLDTQLAVLRREMFGLRQLDLSLLSQLWALNESIQEFRTMLQEQETLSPPSPSPSPSDANSVSSDGEDDIPSIGKTQLPPSLQRMRSAPPPPPPTRKAPQRPV